jgi:hypothetical protein
MSSGVKVPATAVGPLSRGGTAEYGFDTGAKGNSGEVRAEYGLRQEPEILLVRFVPVDVAHTGRAIRSYTLGHSI